MFYQADLAFIHDQGFGHFAINAASFLLAVFRQEGIKSGLVVELGCGSGILAERLSHSGYNVLGVDRSPEFIEIARDRVPQAQFDLNSFFQTSIPSCQAVTAIGECFNYTFDPENTAEKRQELFSRIYEALHPGGYFLFDFAQLGRIPTSPFYQHWETEQWAILVKSEEDQTHSHLTRYITTFRKMEEVNRGDFFRRDREVHHLQLFKQNDIVNLLETIGFQVQLLDRYSEFKLPGSLVAVLAKKPQ